MTSVGKWFVTTAIAYGVLGMLLGLHIAMTHDHGQMPTHAHIMVIGWVSFFLFGLFYLQFGRHVSLWMSVAHLVMAQLSMLGLVTGLWLLYSGQSQYEPVAAFSALGYAFSFLVFAFVGLPAVWKIQS